MLNDQSITSRNGTRVYTPRDSSRTRAGSASARGRAGSGASNGSLSSMLSAGIGPGGIPIPVQILPQPGAYHDALTYGGRARAGAGDAH